MASTRVSRTVSVDSLDSMPSRVVSADSTSCSSWTALSFVRGSVAAARTVLASFASARSCGRQCTLGRVSWGVA